MESGTCAGHTPSLLVQNMKRAGRDVGPVHEVLSQRSFMVGTHTVVGVLQFLGTCELVHMVCTSQPSLYPTRLSPLVCSRDCCVDRSNGHAGSVDPLPGAVARCDSRVLTLPSNRTTGYAYKQGLQRVGAQVRIVNIQVLVKPCAKQSCVAFPNFVLP